MFQHIFRCDVTVSSRLESDYYGSHFGVSTLPVYLQMKIACISYSPPIYCSRVVGISLFHTQAIFKGNPHYISVQIWCTCIPLCSQFHIILLFVTTLRYVSHISCICIFSKIISYACAMHESVPLVNEFTRYDAHKKKRQLNFSLRAMQYSIAVVHSNKSECD